MAAPNVKSCIRGYILLLLYRPSVWRDQVSHLVCIVTYCGCCSDLVYGGTKCHELDAEYIACADPTGCGLGTDSLGWDYQVTGDSALVFALFSDFAFCFHILFSHFGSFWFTLAKGGPR